MNEAEMTKTLQQMGFDHGLLLAETASNTWIAARIQDVVTDVQSYLETHDREALDFALGEITGLAQGIKSF